LRHVTAALVVIESIAIRTGIANNRKRTRGHAITKRIDESESASEGAENTENNIPNFEDIQLRESTQKTPNIIVSRHRSISSIGARRRIETERERKQQHREEHSGR
jgi:hypothetical protein